jgi:hypothetical protein
MTTVITVAAVEPLAEHWLRVGFSDDSVKDVNVSPLLERGEIFRVIRERREVFEQVAVNPDSGTIEWPGGIDLDPEVLYGSYEPASGAPLERRTVEDPRADMRRILEQLAKAPHDHEGVPVEDLRKMLDLPKPRLYELLERLDGWGLVAGSQGELPYLATRAGEQFLACEGRVGRDVLRFLPHVIDDFHTRRALLVAGSVVVEEFKYALLAGNSVEHARELVPPAFAPAITEPIAVSLFAAAVALMARLSSGEAAGCVAEEILAVAVMNEAASVLESDYDEGRLSEEARQEATAELRGLFELFQDDDVLQLFEMQEPADAAVASESTRNVLLGVVDQRLTAWFEPFVWTINTGYLETAPDHEPAPLEETRADPARSAREAS